MIVQSRSPFDESRPWGGIMRILFARQYRLPILALVVAFLLVTVYWQHDRAADYASTVRAGASSFLQNQNGRAVDVTVRQDAHKIEWADWFEPHFKNLTKAPKITLQQAKKGCNFPKPEEVNFAFGESSGWGLDLSWVTKDRGMREINARRKEWMDFILDEKKLLPYDAYADQFNGKGIVIVGGQGRSLKRVRVILKQLTRLGCKLPIEIHYWGAEMSSEARADIAKRYHTIYFQNIASPHSIKGSYYYKIYGIHYSLKTVALINARFEEIIMLDSDNIPVIDPAKLFESETYKEYGSVFWPDIARTRINNPIWAITNTPCQSVTEWELESGQLMVNKKKFFYHLQLAAWFIDDVEGSTDGYFKSLMLGDKDTFRWAWHALQTKYGTPDRWITSVGTLNDDYFCGHSFAQHHPDKDGDIAFLHGGLMKQLRKPVVQYQKDVNGGIFQAYKRDPNDQDKSSNINVNIKWDGQSYLPESYKPPEGLVAGQCTDFFDIDARPLEEILPSSRFSNEIFEEIGGYWMLEEGNDKHTLDGAM